jgi:hypothetical protein
VCLENKKKELLHLFIFLHEGGMRWSAWRERVRMLGCMGETEETHCYFYNRTDQIIRT